MGKILLVLAIAVSAFSLEAAAFRRADRAEAPPPAATGEATGNSLRIGVLDLNRVNSDARVMRNLTQQRDRELERVRTDMEAKRVEFEGRESDLRARQVVMSAEAFGRDVAQFQREVREAEVAIQRRGEAIERAFLEALRQIQANHMDHIYREVGTRHGFDMLLTSQSAFLINNSLDVTDEIIRALDGRVREMRLEIAN